MDINKFIDDNDFATPKELPYAQWINPQNDGCGLGIVASQAELAGFKPSPEWKKEKITFGSSEEEIYIAQEPRLIILNGSGTIDAKTKGVANPLYMHNKKTSEKTIFEKEKFYADKENWVVYRPLFFFPVSQDNELLSATPFVFNMKRVSHRSLYDVYQNQWLPQLLNAYKAQGINFPQGKRPTCSFLSRNVFEPIIQKSKLQALNSNASSAAAVCIGFKQIEFEKVAIPLDSPVSGVIKDYLANLLDLIALKVKPQEEAKPVAEIDPDDFTDENGEVHLPLDAMPF